MKFFFDADADLSVLDGKTIAVIGFGSQGSAQAQCMKDSGLKVIIGLQKNSKSVSAAEKLGFKVFETKDAVKIADIVCMLFPDEAQPKTFEKEIAPFLDGKKALCFAHGFNIVFGKIFVPANTDVFMVSPHAPGPAVREKFVEGNGAIALLAVHQNVSGNAKKTALAIAKANGFTRAGAYFASFEEETFSDLFGEQAVLCGGLSELVKKGFETLTEAGYPKELAFLSCAYEISSLAKLVSENGVNGMFEKVSNTAEFGARTRGPKIIGESAKKAMKRALKQIESKKFAKEWIKESDGGQKKLLKLRKQQAGHGIEKAFRSLEKILSPKFPKGQ